MPTFKVVRRTAIYEDEVYFVSATDEETACRKIRPTKMSPVRVEKNREVSVAAVLATADERETLASNDDSVNS